MLFRSDSKEKLKPVYDSKYLNENIEIVKLRVNRLEKNIIPAKKIEEKILVLDNNLDTVKAKISIIEGTNNTVSESIAESIADTKQRLTQVENTNTWHDEVLRRIEPLRQAQKETVKDLLRQKNEITKLKVMDNITEGEFHHVKVDISRMKSRVDGLETGLEYLQRFIGDEICVNIEQMTQENTDSITTLTSEVEELASKVNSQLEIREIVREIVQEIISNNS